LPVLFRSWHLQVRRRPYKAYDQRMSHYLGDKSSGSFDKGSVPRTRNVVREGQVPRIISDTKAKWENNKREKKERERRRREKRWKKYLREPAECKWEEIAMSISMVLDICYVIQIYST